MNDDSETNGLFAHGLMVCDYIEGCIAGEPNEVEKLFARVEKFFFLLATFTKLFASSERGRGFRFDFFCRFQGGGVGLKQSGKFTNCFSRRHPFIFSNSHI